MHLLGASEGESARQGILGALLRELAGEVLVFDPGFLDGNDGRGSLGTIGVGPGRADNGQELRHGYREFGGLEKPRFRK